jgi:hypothetical protein
MPAFLDSHTLNDAHEQIVTDGSSYPSRDVPVHVACAHDFQKHGPKKEAQSAILNLEHGLSVTG